MLHEEPILLCAAHVIHKLKDSVSRIRKTVFKSLLRYLCLSFYEGYIIRDDWKGDSKISDADRQGNWQTRRVSFFLFFVLFFFLKKTVFTSN